MEKEEFINLLQSSESKMKILNNKELINSVNLTNKELIDIIRDNLSDEEKLKMLHLNHFINAENVLKVGIINSMSNSSLRLQVLDDEEISSSFSPFQYKMIVQNLDSNILSKVLRDSNFISRSGLEPFEIVDIINNLDDNSKKEILEDSDYISKTLSLTNYDISNILGGIDDDAFKLDMINNYHIKGISVEKVLRNVKNNDLRIQYIKENENDLGNVGILRILETCSFKDLKQIITQNSEILKENDIDIYKLFGKNGVQNTQEMVGSIEELGLSLNEMKEIIAVVSNEVEGVDYSGLPDELKKVVGIDLFDKEKRYMFKIDSEVDIENYRGLDRLIKVNPMTYNKEQKERLKGLLDVCPNLSIVSSIGIENALSIYNSTKSEYLDAEKWIEEVLSKIPEDYSKLQKIALIDNAIGKKISYSPDFETEVYDPDDSRAIYKIISTGYGVCNGIATIEQLLLSRVGIESEVVSSKDHAFVLVKDVIDGKSTIVDPTWNLTSERYGSRPNNFCVNYEEIRKHDIDSNGIDTESHKNDEKLSDVTFMLSDEELRNVYHSVGLIDDSLRFPVKNLVSKSKEIDDMYKDDEKENIKHQLSMFQEMYPDFASCINSSISIISNTVLNHDNLNYNSLVVNRVYAKDDEEKRPVLYVYMESLDGEKIFYSASTDSKEFECISEEEFTKRFECYEYDLTAFNRSKALGG